MKITYHISCCNFIDGHIYALYTDEFERELTNRLQAEGIKYIRVYEVQKIFVEPDNNVVKIKGGFNF